MPNFIEPMSYEEWIKQNPDVELREKECPECSGDGTITCFHCGSEYDCEKCDGKGVLSSAREEYETQRKKDLKLLRTYNQLRQNQLEKANQNGTLAPITQPI